MTIGEKIRERRIEMGLTQEDVAMMLGYKSRSSVNKVELSSDLTLKIIKKYAEVLKLDPAELIGFEEKSKYSDIDVHKSMDLVLNPENKELIDIINKLESIEKKELLDYAKFLISKRAANAAP